VAVLGALARLQRGGEPGREPADALRLGSRQVADPWHVPPRLDEEGAEDHALSSVERPVARVHEVVLVDGTARRDDLAGLFATDEAIRHGVSLPERRPR